MIEDIKVLEPLHDGSGPQVQISVVSGTQVCPPTIVKPSSLNYKIGLRSAVEEFVKKESKIDDYELQVEEYAQSEEQSSSQPAQDNKALFNLCEDLDDALYQMSVQVLAKLKSEQPKQTGNQWDQEEEKIKKRIERNALNSLKFKYATNINQINQQTVMDTGVQVQQAQQMVRPQQQILPMAQQQQQQVQGIGSEQQALSADQLEEAKALTATKLKQFKKDRLFQNDFDRIGQLSELLKRVRQNDNVVFQKATEINIASSRPSGQSISPQKQGGGQTSFVISQKQDQVQNQNVMTQISSIVNKRSRSTNNQNGTVGANLQSVTNANIRHQDETLHQVGIGGNLNTAEKVGIKNNAALEALNAAKSPRVNRAKNISPPSRDKSFLERQGLLGQIGLPAQQALMNQTSHQPSFSHAEGGNNFLSAPGQSPIKVQGTGGPAYQYQNVNATFYNGGGSNNNNNHRKTYSNKLPQIQGSSGGHNNNSNIQNINNKTVDSSMSNTYYPQ